MEYNKLPEIKNGVQLGSVYKTLRNIEIKLIGCIMSFKVFLGNWTFELCGRNRPLSSKA